MICFAKRILTGLAKGGILNNMIHVLYIHLTKDQHIHKRLISSERVLHKDYDHKGSVEKKSLVLSPEGLGAKMI
jgi:hypothetical protein